MERDKTAVRPVAVFLLVHGGALDPRRQARRSPGNQGASDLRRPGVARNVAGYMLADAGIDLERDNVRIVPPPPPYGDKGFMARNGVDSIIQNTADAYWGNGMRVALGEHLGIAKLHLDLRRGDGPPGARHYNFAALTTRERIISEHPEVAAGAIRAIVKAQKTLKANPSISTEVG